MATKLEQAKLKAAGREAWCPFCGAYKSLREIWCVGCGRTRDQQVAESVRRAREFWRQNQRKKG